MIPVPLPNVTLIIVDTISYGDAVNAVLQSLKQITPARVIMFTDIELNIPPIEVIQIPHLHSKKEYSKWMMKELGKQPITTSHILVIQADGYVIKGDCWDDEWLKLDFLGAPWLETDGFNNGNGGFSLRSMALHQALAEDELIKPIHPEDNAICRVYRDHLEKEYGFKWANDEQGDRFSFELRQPKDYTFGFHQYFHAPYKEPIVFKRDAALGDCISLEPVFEHFHNLGHPIVFDSPFYLPFARHHFPVIDYRHFDHGRVKHRLINLNLAYEMKPQQLHLKSYFEMCGVTDYKLRNPKLNYHLKDEHRLFKQKYVILHIDERATPHRNVHGVDWYAVGAHLESLGYLVVQIGNKSNFKVGVQFNTVGEQFLMWAIKGANAFIGIDSGPSHIAVAFDIPCILTFGSVDPTFIHPDLSNVFALRSACPINELGCWHKEPGTTGRLCPVNSQHPPCTVLSTEIIMNAIKQMGI